jgi:hypothetical protein
MELTAQITFDIADPASSYEAELDLVLLPENSGTDALRELRYPGDILPPLVYDDYPDKTENFDTTPLTARPLLKGDMTVGDYQLTQWPGNLKDRPVREIWSGGDQRSRMTAYFFRRLWEYFANPPAAGYITWNPKDRADKAYNIVIESLTAGGQDTVSFDFAALKNGVVTGEIIFQFRVIGEA